MKPIIAILLLMRPRQWTKNTVVFAGLIFSAKFLSWPLFWKVSQGFLAFCLAAGAVYIFNDLHDLPHDRLHPEKRKRPLVSGAITPELAGLSDIALFAAALGFALSLEPRFALALLGYMLLNLAYTLGLKRFVILDVFIISAGFVLRAVGGAFLAGVEISPWLLVVATLLSLFLGFAKRRHELLLMGTAASRHRHSLADYSPALLDQFMSVVASSTIIAYSLYAFTSDTALRHHALMLTIPFVIYGILRYLYLVYQRNLGGNPETVLLTDKPLLFAIGLWVLSVGFILSKG